jgi:hypothetical protein
MCRTPVNRWGIFSGVLVLISTVTAPAASPAPEQLFPATTTEFVAISDVNRMTAAWQITQFARLLHDPTMEAFLNDLYGQTKGFNFLLDTIGCDFEMVKAAAGGELGWGVVLVNPQEVAHVLTLDITGRTPQAQALLNEIAKQLHKKGAQWDRRMLDGGMQTIVARLPNQIQLVYGLKDSVLVISDHLPTVQGLLARWVGTATNSLANVPAYRAVRRKSQPLAGETEMIRFYFEPTNRMEALMIYFPDMKKVKGDNLVQVMRKEGVDGIKGVGGVIAFRTNNTDMLIRVSTFGPQPFQGAMRMARFPNVAPITPDSWVPADLSSYLTFGLDLVNAFDSFDTFFERVTDEPPGTFKAIMDSVRDDKDGPQVDIRRDIMERLQPRVTLVNDATLPAAPKCERYLVGIPAKSPEDEKVLAEAIRKCFETDRRFKAKNYQGITVWEYQARVKQRKSGKPTKVDVPGLCITVCRGHLFVATNFGLLERILNNQDQLAQSTDFQRMMRELTRLGMGPSSFRGFIRTDVAAQATYEMIQSNRVDQANSVYGWLLTKVLKDASSGKMLADGRKLPPYDRLTKYLSTAGGFGRDDGDGWTFVGVVLDK